ncbi:MAG: hypothetical protein A2Z78_01875 [Candidatus Nealsonbacteria bacterium RBG_13_36_15]|uniref:Glycosyltransferase RgtA/B/C/D-like domain-containing protein n=1 Tax=Candidatus Nealsonbacteria bacterium RBG_13_36_15 TaxID=1801660 RepID=A0A1G2DWN1_9BACT|nr:MAG: hypothetical protein A2Z78_01875 [Candidatus Nealsonbacteria bacterium RBG_13_36_15]
MKNKRLLILLLILAIAAFFRLWQLDKIPPGLYPDVAIYANDGLNSLQNRDFKVFYPENNGREGLYMWLLALSFSIFGVSVWSIKIVTATIGILTVLGLYFLTKEILQTISYRLQATNIALLASFFLATSFWHTNFSRIGFRAILVPFILVFALYFLIKAFRTQKLSDFILSGIFWGMGFYTYISFRMAVIILAVIIILKFIEYLKKEKPEISRSHIWKKLYLKDGWWKVDVFLIVIFLVALPIGIYFLQHPQDFMGRAAGVSIFQQGNPVKAGILSLISHLGMFNFYGDGNWRHNFANSPMIFWPVGILFLIGIIISIKELIFSIKTKNCSLFIAYCLLFSWFFAMLLPGILTYEGIPHSLRVIGVIPVVYIFSAIGGFAVYQRLKNIIKNPIGLKLILAICLLFFVFVGFSEFYKYFFTWAKNENVEGAFTKKFVEIGYYLNSLPPETEKYVIVNEPGVPVPWPNGIPMPAQTVMLIERTKFGQPKSTYLLPENLDKIKIENGVVIVPMKYDEDLFRELSQRFPEGEIKIIDGIWVYKING